MTRAIAHRDPQSGEFSCLVAGQALLTGKTSTSIKRVFDMVDAINVGHKPDVATTGTGDGREFYVIIGSFKFLGPTGALKAYRELDKLEAALAGTVLVEAHEQPGTSEAAPLAGMGTAAGLSGVAGLAQVMPDVFDPDQMDPDFTVEDLPEVEGEMQQ